MTIARLQRLSTLLIVLLALGWALALAERGHAVAALGGAFLVAFGYALFLAVEFVMLLRHGIDVPSLRPKAGQVLRAWWGEVLRTPLVFCWRQPFRRGSEPDLITADAVDRRGVLFVHGFVCNRALWNPWMRRLRERGVPFVAVDLEPPFGSIDRYPAVLGPAAAKLRAATGRPPVVVAHSMGGLAVRAWLANELDAGAAVHRVVTIATPHGGTWLARFALTRNGVEMQRGSPWFESLRARESAMAHGRFVCYWGHCDNIVFPISSATLAGADCRHLEATAHVQMVYHPQVLIDVLALLQD
jgi:triacylglycerol esterase/lipase EstA (alpha/beta hydrolase family)